MEEEEEDGADLEVEEEDGLSVQQKPAGRLLVTLLSVASNDIHTSVIHISHNEAHQWGPVEVTMEGSCCTPVMRIPSSQSQWGLSTALSGNGVGGGGECAAAGGGGTGGFTASSSSRGGVSVISILKECPRKFTLLCLFRPYCPRQGIGTVPVHQSQ